MRDYISKAFKSLEEELGVDIEESVYLKESEDEEPKVILDLFNKDSSYNIIHDFEIDGSKYSLYIESTCDGESCDATFGEYNQNNIDGVIVDVLDSERNFIGTVHDISLDTSIEDAIEKSKAVINGEEKEIFKPEKSEEEEPEANIRLFIGEDEPESTKEKSENSDSKGIKEEALTEAKSFKITDSEDLEKASEMINKSEDDVIEKIVDISAESKDNLKKSYIGSAILRCPTCKTMVYKDVEDLVKAEGEEEVYNVDEECPHCGAKDGYEIVGQVASLSTDEEAEPTEPIINKSSKEQEEKEVELEPKEKEEPEIDLDVSKEEPEIKEDLIESQEEKEIISTSLDDNKKLTIYVGNRVLAEIEDGKQDKAFIEDVLDGMGYIWNEDGTISKKIEETCKDCEEENKVCPECGKEICECDRAVKEELSLPKESTIELKTFDEGSFDRLVKGYLRETYSNIKDYTTTEASLDDSHNKIILEGVISFKSGKTKPTKFMFEAKELTKKGKIKFSGINEMFSDKNSFTLVGESRDNKLLSESLSYSYKINESKVTGRVCSAKRR